MYAESILLFSINFIEMYRAFVLSEGLKKIQEIKGDSKIKVLVDEINALYPQEVVQYYSPDYAATLLRKLDENNE